MIIKEKYSLMRQQELNDRLLNASYQGNLDVIKYILTSPDLTTHANINAINSKGENALMIACSAGKFEVVEYLLTSHELKEHANINDKNRNSWSALMFACQDGYLEIVKYLFSTPILAKYASDEERNNQEVNTLEIATIHENLDIVQYLIIDRKIKIDKKRLDWLKEGSKEIDFYSKVLKMIESRDLHNKLDSSLETDIFKNNKKIKI